MISSMLQDRCCLHRDVTRQFDFPFVVGGLIQMPIVKRLSIQADGLYRRLRYPNDPSVIVTWEVPVLAKYPFSSRKVAPFVQGGPAFRAAGNLNSSNPSHYGLSLGQEWTSGPRSLG